MIGTDGRVLRPGGPDARRGGAAVAAHPFHPYRGGARGHRSLAGVLPDLPGDALEAPPIDLEPGQLITRS
jgi:hypothetical protein